MKLFSTRSLLAIVALAATASGCYASAAPAGYYYGRPGYYAAPRGYYGAPRGYYAAPRPAYYYTPPAATVYVR